MSFAPGPLQAEIAFCSARQYADAFDVLSGVSRDGWDDDDVWTGLVPHEDPWAWKRESMMDEHALEIREENLADLEADDGFYPADLRARLLELDCQRMREHKVASLFSMPYLSTDRPGLPSLAGRLWNDRDTSRGQRAYFCPPRRAAGPPAVGLRPLARHSTSILSRGPT